MQSNVYHVHQLSVNNKFYDSMQCGDCTDDYNCKKRSVFVINGYQDQYGIQEHKESIWQM